MRRILPLLALSTAITLLVVGLGNALNAGTNAPTADSGNTTVLSPDGTTPSKWTETQFGRAPKKTS